MEADFWFWFMAPIGITAGLGAAIIIALALWLVAGIFIETFKLIIGK